MRHTDHPEIEAKRGGGTGSGPAGAAAVTAWCGGGTSGRVNSAAAPCHVAAGPCSASWLPALPGVPRVSPERSPCLSKAKKYMALGGRAMELLSSTSPDRSRDPQRPSALVELTRTPLML